MVLMGGIALVASFVMGATAIGAAQQAKPIPNFTFVGSGWLGQGGTNFIAPKSGPGPIKNDPKFPYVGNNDTPGNQSTERVGDANDPILQPWAAEVVRQHNDLVHKGRRSFVAQARCWPGGGPAQLLFPAEPIFFIQRAQEVHIIWQRDHHVRRVMMNVPHSANPKPSWFGESVGHYEGDTLVVDTIGLNDKAPVDHFDTPHSAELHVVERWRLVDGGETLELKIYIEDPGAFTTPWTAFARYSRTEGIARRTHVQSVSILSSPGEGPLLEAICAENPNSIAGADAPPVVQSMAPDF
jgi:hypothetical protein